jgi:hypothetical protein
MSDADRLDRKALTRAYKESVRPMGVYRVRSTESGRSIVAASRDLPSALNRQRAQLRMNGHPDKALQKEWAASGGDTFVFEVLDTLEPTDEPGYDPTDDLDALEKMWLERLTTGNTCRAT